MTDVFISYSRKDKEFVQVLHQALSESKYDAWVDWEDIPLTADWWEEIKAGIEAANTFLFVISPDSVASKVCNWEVDHAAANSKRIVPIVRRDRFDSVEIHRALSKHHWLFFREQDDFESTFSALVNALNTDLAYVKAHTRMLVRSLEWEKKQRRDDLLLRGQDLTEAEEWLDAALRSNQEPLPTEQQKTYIHKSREVEEANQRLTAAGEKAKRLVKIGAGILAGTVVIAAIIGIITQRNVVRTRQLAQLEQDGVNALRQFEYQEIKALLQAMHATEDLKQLMGGGDKPLQHYAPHSPPWVLQQILDNIRQTNEFSNNPDDSPDRGGTYVTLSPDGKILAIAASDGAVSLKTLQGNNVATLHGHYERVYQTEFSPDGQQIATASRDGTVRLWNRNGALIKVLEHPSQRAIGRARYSRNGQYLAVSAWGNKEIVLFDAKGDLISSIISNPVYDIAFSPDSQTLVSISYDGAIQFWNLQGQEIATLKGHTSPVTSVEFSPDGNYLLTGAGDATARIWDLQTKESVVIPDLQGWVNAVDFHPDGHQVAIASSGGIVQIWDIQGNLIYNFPGHSGSPESVSFSPDGDTLVTSADDGDIRVWSLRGKEIAGLDGHNAGIWNAAFSPDGAHIATASVDGATRIWDLTGEEVGRLELPDRSFNNVVYSPDGNLIVTSTHQSDIQLWDLEGNLIDSFEQHTKRILGLDFSPDGRHIVSGSDDNTAKLWDLDGNLLTIVKHDHWIRDVAFSPDGQSFATASEDDFAHLWDLDGNLLAEFEGHADGVDGVSFSPDGTQLVTSSDDSTVKLWDLQGNLIHSFQKHHGRVWTVEFSPDGESIATGASDGYARLWDLEGNPIGEFKGHEEMISSVNFSPDGQYLVTTSLDGTAKVWRVAQTLDDLLHQGCEWLEDYLAVHPNELAELEVCQSEEVLRKAASQLVAQGDSLAKEGEQKGAISIFRTAKAWNPNLDFKPEIRARQFAYIGEAEALAQAGEIDSAIATFQKALDLDANLELDPQQEVRRIAIDALIKQGIASAETGDAAAAEVIFREALALDPNLPFDPQSKAQQLAATALVKQALEHISSEEFGQAIAKVNQVNSLDLAVGISGEEWANLCLQAALNGFAAEILQACDYAVEFDPIPERWRSRRGLARAIAGDMKGAIEDFQAFISGPSTPDAYWKESLEARIQTRQAWLDALRAGENPFTPEKIEELKNGGF